jgi:hypothetical protein
MTVQSADSASSAGSTRAADAPERLCDRCGYDLRDLPQERCPECGLPFDRRAAPTPQIPWLRRRRVGGPAAFWQTVLMATFSPRRFAAEFMNATRVSTADARGFGRRCVALAAASAVVVMLVASPAPLRRTGADVVVLVLAAVLAAWVFFGVLAATTPFDPMLTALTGEHLWLNALNSYAAAPLAFSPAPAAAACAGIACLRSGGVLRDVGLALLLLAAAGVLAQFLALGVSGLAMVRQVRRFGLSDTVWSALGLPLRWLGIVVLTLLVLLALACPLAALAGALS